MEHTEIDMIAHSKRGVITLCLSPSTGANITFSLLVAERIAKELHRGTVLYLNTVQPRRVLASEIRKHVSARYSAKNPDPRITYLSCVAGVLNSLEADIRGHLEAGVRFIILNSLEFSSKDYRRKDDLFFQLQVWADEFDAAVIVFSQRVKAIAEKGTIQRGGGVGKFAGVAASINYLAVKKKDDEEEDMDDEGFSGSEWEDQVDEAERERERIEREAEEKLQEEEDLLEQAEVLASEGPFLEADVPVWKAADEEEEKAVIKTFCSCHVTFWQKSFESDEHFYKRLMAAIAVDMEICPARYPFLEQPFRIVHSNEPEKLFADELLPEGTGWYDYYFPDKLPLPGIRKPRLKKKEDSARELLT